ncbi:MAG: class I SAM-dependent methyltransferase [Planctomycetes bacterium]|nr:class I SAM-dependent methyltransferase [Planctomycetota bacterium]
MIPDWQLPSGVDRGLWDYLHAADMVAGYDEQMRSSHLARADVAFCEYAFRAPGKLLDLGCGTGRLCAHFAAKGFECVGVDLSDEMLAKARENAPTATFLNANLVELGELPERSFDYAACLFSTLGMVRGAENRAKVLANAFRVLKPGGRFVLHAHNRFYRGLGWKQVTAQRLKTLFGRATAGDVTMPQAYGGAPLTLHHFTFGEAWRLLGAAGFEKKAHQRVSERKYLPGQRWPNGTYGYLFLGQRPTAAPNGA